MAIVNTKGKVSTYNISTGSLVCHRTGAFIWRGNKVRTTGDHDSVCNPTTSFMLDVTVSRATAEKLVPNFEFELEYDDSGTNPVKRVTKFAGEVIRADAATVFSTELASATASASLPLPTLPAESSPSSLPPAP
jgi:hypothetical protein